MKLRMAACLALCLLWETRALAQEPPIWVSPDRMTSQRVAGETRIRSQAATSGGPDSGAGGINLDLTVDESGAVVAVDPSPEYDRPEELGIDTTERTWIAEASAAARQWRFRPFVRDGRARRARGRVVVTVVPRERARRQARAPEFRREDVAITLVRGHCDGDCGGAGYSVTIGGDGRVRFVAQASSGWNGGEHRSTIAQERVDALIARFREADFWSLDFSYIAPGVNPPVHALTFSAGGLSWTVVELDGARVGMPDAVTALEDAVDETAGTGRWLATNANTIAALEAENFDFRSEPAYFLLLSLIGNAPDAHVLRLIDRGAPLDWANPCSSCIEAGIEALIDAAMTRGRVAIFDRLLYGASDAHQGSLYRLLERAANLNSVYFFGRLVARGASMTGRDSRRGWATPLIAALSPGTRTDVPDADQQAIVRLLLAGGVDVNARDAAGQSALQRAHDDDPAIVRMLIRAGGDVNAATPADRDRDRVVVPPILYLTLDEEVALVALEAGANRNLRNAAGETLLQIARRLGWTRVQRLLRR